jgi:hypothetical protein
MLRRSAEGRDEHETAAVLVGEERSATPLPTQPTSSRQHDHAVAAERAADPESQQRDVQLGEEPDEAHAARRS